MPFLYFGFFLVMAAWLFWAIAWAVVWAVVMLAWPVAVVLAGIALWRAFVSGSRRKRADTPFGAWSAPAGTDAATANSAFDEYRAETLRTLDEEQGKFREFLERLRKSRDRKEFDSFMAARRGRPAIAQGEAPPAV